MGRTTTVPPRARSARKPDGLLESVVANGRAWQLSIDDGWVPDGTQGMSPMTVKSILVVADAQTDRVRLERIVSRAGYTVIRTSSGAKALESVVEEKPDLVLLDVVMDEMDGYEATRRLMHDGSTRHIPVIFVSSKNQKADRVWARMQGGRELVSKPYTPGQIIDQLKLHC